MGQEQRQPDDSYKELVNSPEQVQAFGRTYEIKRLALGPLTRAAEHLAPLGYLMRSVNGGEIDIGQMIAQVLNSAGEPAMGLLSVITEEPVEWLEQQDPIEAFELLSVFVEKNVRYFFDSANKQRIEVAYNRIKNAVSKESGATATTSSAADMAH